MKKISLLGLLALVMLLLSGCGPTAHIEKARGVNLNNYKTFAWAQKDVRKSKRNVMEQQITDAVSENHIKTKGWQEVKRNPDVIISYDVLVEKSSRVASNPVYTWGGFRTFYNPYRRHFYRVYYPQRFIGYDNYRVPIKEGTIAITMVDAKTDQTILQGWATDELDYNRITSAEADRIVNAIMKKWQDTQG